MEARKEEGDQQKQVSRRHTTIDAERGCIEEASLQNVFQGCSIETIL